MAKQYFSRVLQLDRDNQLAAKRIKKLLQLSLKNYLLCIYCTFNFFLNSNAELQNYDLSSTSIGYHHAVVISSTSKMLISFMKRSELAYFHGHKHTHFPGYQHQGQQVCKIPLHVNLEFRRTF